MTTQNTTSRFNSIRFAGIGLFFIFATCIAGCSSSEEVEPNTPNSNGQNDASDYVTIAGNKFSTPNGYLLDLGDVSKYNSRNYLVDLSNGSFNGSSYSNATTTVISFDFNSGSQSEFSEGLYTFDPDTDVYGLPVQKPFTFANAYANVGLKYENGNLVGGSRYNDITGGTIEVNKTANGFEVIYDLSFTGDVKVTGTYNGPLAYFKMF